MAKSSIHIKPENEGKLHRHLGVAEDEPIPTSELTIPKGSSANALAVKREVVFARNARKWNHKKKA
jgi:hypothetical protein